MFITFEGIDGSGKTTQVGRVAAHLREQGHRVELLREPGGTDIGDQIRAVLLDNLKNTAMDARTELLLFCASRAQLVAERIRPALEEGIIILCDRYSDSTLAYQGYGHGLDLPTLRTILGFATSGLAPDLTIYFDLDPQEGLRRRRKRMFQGEDWNRLDALEIAFHQRVYEGYQALMTQAGPRWTRIDAAHDEEAVFAAVVAVLSAHLTQPTRPS